MDRLEKARFVWTKFPLKTTVQIVVGIYRGRQGRIVEVLDDRIDGFARYCLESGGIRLDYSRHELKRVKRVKRPRRRLPEEVWAGIEAEIDALESPESRPPPDPLS